MSDVNRILNSGHFKSQRSISPSRHASKAVAPEKPGQCVEDSRKLSDTSFILKNPLISDLVNAVDQPILVEGPSKPDLTQIAVIGGVKSADRTNVTYDVVFIGRNDGHILKAIKVPGHGSVLIEVVKVFDNPPTVIQAIRPIQERNELVVVGSDRVAKIPIYHCGKQNSCSRCVALRDPHCAWDTENLMCVHALDWNSGSFVQNVAKGISAQCPEGINNNGDPAYAINMPIMDEETPTDSFNQLVDDNKDVGFSGSTIAMLVILVIFVACAVGFMIGYRISRKRFINELQTAHSSGSSSNGSDYDSYGRARLTRHDSLTTASKLGADLYSMAPHKVSDTMSLVIGHGQHIPVMTASVSNAN
uniref:Sema domain-containing protein n=2 Tax=Panagrolaimus sp. JU765 TaxID=591449 RepID=A0AC34R5U2_9BILA